MQAFTLNIAFLTLALAGQGCTESEKKSQTSAPTNDDAPDASNEYQTCPNPSAEFPEEPQDGQAFCHEGYMYTYDSKNNRWDMMPMIAHLVTASGSPAAESKEPSEGAVETIKIPDPKNPGKTKNKPFYFDPNCCAYLDAATAKYLENLPFRKPKIPFYTPKPAPRPDEVNFFCASDKERQPQKITLEDGDGAAEIREKVKAECCPHKPEASETPVASPSSRP